MIDAFSETINSFFKGGEIKCSLYFSVEYRETRATDASTSITCSRVRESRS